MSSSSMTEQEESLGYVGDNNQKPERNKRRRSTANGGLLLSKMGNKTMNMMNMQSTNDDDYMSTGGYSKNKLELTEDFVRHPSATHIMNYSENGKVILNEVNSKMTIENSVDYAPFSTQSSINLLSPGVGLTQSIFQAMGDGVKDREESTNIINNNSTQIQMTYVHHDNNYAKKFSINYINTQITKEELEMKYNIDTHILLSYEELLRNRDPNYLDHHKFIDTRMRTILLDWVMEVCAQLGFKRSTYHSSVVLIDIFLSKIENIQTNQLQLTGVTCLIIAAKNEVKLI
jgi:hypothetical protein